MYYAGIGSRATPDSICNEFSQIGLKLADAGYILRSGGADGADYAFEFGCDASLNPSNKEIILPWHNFNGSKSKFILEEVIPDNVTAIYRSIYIKYPSASKPVERLHSRNVYQILGMKLDSPVKFVVCWSDRDDNDCGGTNFGIKLARIHSIPIYNFYNFTEKILFYSQVLDKLGKQ